MLEIDRMAIVIRPKQTFLDWINACSKGDKVSLEEIQQDATLLLVPVFEDEQELTAYIEGSYGSIFEQELESWCLDSDLWPRLASFEEFLGYFDIEVHEMVFDMVAGDYDMEEVTLQ